MADIPVRHFVVVLNIHSIFASIKSYQERMDFFYPALDF